MTSNDQTLRVQCETPEATGDFGACVASVIEPGDVVILTGELGAGKTTFVKGVVRALGDEESVTSPTFVLCHLYDTEPVVAHVDCWRLENPEEVIDLALTEVLDEGGVAFIEWGDIAAQSLGADFARLSFVIDDQPSASSRDATDTADDGSPTVSRTITIETNGTSWNARRDRLRSALSSCDLIAIEDATCP